MQAGTAIGYVYNNYYEGFCEYWSGFRWCQWAKKTYNPQPFVGDGYGSMTEDAKSDWEYLKCFQSYNSIYEGTGAQCLSWINNNNVVQGASGVTPTNWGSLSAANQTWYKHPIFHCADIPYAAVGTIERKCQEWSFQYGVVPFFTNGTMPSSISTQFYDWANQCQFRSLVQFDISPSSGFDTYNYR
jgi:hypothetical protein